VKMRSHAGANPAYIQELYPADPGWSTLPEDLTTWTKEQWKEMHNAKAE
jgi:hypothetical protein